ncbi:DUF4327 family protein [filamentous cyanobacterium LEGE 11480]|uniref:DUF4327 family protein n=1 Tax=Romeriopsis navalis LEGE 11480 TaxID=2777977 RepID=A0A928VT92_9CYAN|nr:DUF4327 family protein [Romeriopsis navalis]MBE9031674.1 DUF4327 family protein [Romeriopsis navalis LEGE 11480]
MLKLTEYSIPAIQDEVQALVTKGLINRKNHIYDLAKHFGYNQWQEIERLLEFNDYLLRDNISELLGQEVWMND